MCSLLSWYLMINYNFGQEWRENSIWRSNLIQLPPASKICLTSHFDIWKTQRGITLYQIVNLSQPTCKICFNHNGKRDTCQIQSKFWENWLVAPLFRFEGCKSKLDCPTDLLLLLSLDSRIQGNSLGNTDMLLVILLTHQVGSTRQGGVQ